MLDLISSLFDLNVTTFPKLGTKDENYKDSFQNLQECVLYYVVENYNKGVYLAPLIRKLKDFDLYIKGLTALAGT